MVVPQEPALGEDLQDWQTLIPTNQKKERHSPNLGHMIISINTVKAFDKNATVLHGKSPRAYRTRGNMP